MSRSAANETKRAGQHLQPSGPVPESRIAHLDMDAFYASVGLLRHQQLRGQPVVIGGRRLAPPASQADGKPRFARLREYVGRGVITTATYEARALGVHSGMGLMSAGRLPDTSSGRCTRRAGFPVPSASHPKLLAKIASDLDKPDGLTVLTSTDLAGRIWPLPVKKIHGIGPKAAARLHSLGVNTISDLEQADPALLQSHFGRNYAAWLKQAVHGIDERPIVTESEPKSISRETTFEQDSPSASRPGTAGRCTDRPLRGRRRRTPGQGLSGPHRRHQAALRRFPHADPRYHVA